MAKSYWVKVAVAVLVLGWVVFTHFNDQRKIDESLSLSFELTQGKIIYFGYETLQVKLNPRYEFTVGSKKYELTVDDDKFCNLSKREWENKLKGIIFPIAYHPQNPELARILISAADYERFGVSTDSLSAIQRNLLACD